MPRYQVKDGERFPLNGTVHEAGAFVELPRALASDPAIAGLVQEVDEAGKGIASPPADDLERFRVHERVSILRDRRAAAQAVVDAIDAQLKAEDDALAAAVAAAQPTATKTTAVTAPKAPAKE